MVKITLITFTRNSERDLKELLKNVHDVVDEIIVIDSYSTDATIEIAKSYNARVFLAEPLGYVEPYRAYALRKASYEWVLYLDVDEKLNKRLRDDLKDIIETFDEYDAFRILRLNINNRGKALMTFYPHREIRLFKKSKVSFKGIIMEQPRVYGSIMELPEDYFIIHLLKQQAWLASSRKLVKYALLNTRQHYRLQYSKKPLDHDSTLFLLLNSTG